MIYTTTYKSPLSTISLAAKNNQLISLSLSTQPDHISKLKEPTKPSDDYPILVQTKKWLDRYFNHEQPDIQELDLNPIGSAFQTQVWHLLAQIPYGQTITYGDIANQIAQENNMPKMSAQAVGGAVGHNPIPIIIPCHRVVGASNNLVGYTGGLDIKAKLLAHENVDLTKFIIPKSTKNSNPTTSVTRCKWCNLQNPLYVEYHDKEWGVPNFTDQYLLEMLILESFQAGLSWECVLNKRAAFQKAYDNFNLDKVCSYDDAKIKELLTNKALIRNKLKITASINNAKIFKKITLEYGGFYNYLKTFTNDKTYYDHISTSSPLSDAISKDLQNRGMKFVGTTIIYSYLQAIGIINSHEKTCYLFKNNS